jgi:hypothetical protein
VVADLLRQLDAARTEDERDELRVALRREPTAPIVDGYATLRRAEARSNVVYLLMDRARSEDDALELILGATADRARAVRRNAYRALAWSMRREALPALRAAREGCDERDREDVEAAIAAIVEHDHHLWVDRDRSGRSHWLGPDDPVHVEPVVTRRPSSPALRRLRGMWRRARGSGT